MKLFAPLLLIFCFCFLSPKALLAQSDQPTETSGITPMEEEPLDTPIDGGLALLLAAGAGYGLKKHREGKKSRKA